ncbi:hypothetical protein ERO13_A01G008600v2 [Gossypium hirsutum]|uniref:Transcriptional adapter 1 n=1 Tax=Gossypium hirsutum TaxID=3635 RepID=A0A1U8M5B9_GOSHI|nr:uncharacterized protein LOC107934161 [Gossypium hirsutum]XP_040973078.1 uncharacterized protein LOC107934161 [Gossypium hirsutum]KAG4212811.1 hypothetical protein ERO13_A01G008600v2 [Gossypium hirsutum]KAG4212812.1 hypothetical protein ERO13_A01G008600v2 [Gossypium hirsutum]
MVNQDHVRIDTLELKSLIVRKIGHQRAEKYFDQLRKLFGLKIGKSEFDKSCVKIIGRESIPLHNRLIRSIIKNACVSKVPPSKTIRKVGSNLQVGNGYQRNCLQSLYRDAFPPSPRKGRSPVSRDRKFRDRPSPLGPLGKTQSIVPEESISKTQDQSATELLSLGSRPPPDVASVEDGEEVEQVAGSPGVQSRSPVTAPIGISINFSGARKSLPSYHPGTCQTKGELPDTRSLINRLQKKLETEGINIPVDCVNLLNNGLDAYLKRLIEPSIRLAGLRSRSRNYSQRAGERSFNASMMDFRAAMELNPRVLGEDWPLQLEKISLSSLED